MTIVNATEYKSQSTYELIDDLDIEASEKFTVLSDDQQKAVVEMHNEICDDWGGEQITVEDLSDPPEELVEHWQEYHPWAGNQILTEVLEMRDTEYAFLVETHNLMTVVEIER
jgi:hypothetical protein